jgi:5-methylcytosine-specific restriction enzyme subunit McrC
MNNVIYEYKEVHKQHKEFMDYIVNTPLLHKYFKEDWGVLKARQYCGILNFKGEDFYILPKISSDENSNLNIFIYMLRYVYDIKLHNEDIASSKNEQHHNFIEVFVQLFAKGLFKELQHGVYKEYITEQDNLTTLRGKYLINENLKYNFTNAKMYCEYDEFSMNNTLNQFFLFAIKTFLPFVKDKKLLKQCELIFDEVEFRHFDVNNVKVHFNRLNTRYKESFEFAIMLLKKFIPLFESDKKSFAFLFDMNELFEKFIGGIIKEKYENVEIPKQTKSYGELYLKPDIIVQSKRLIVDCKYKIIEDDKIASREDRYQMYVYANNFENIDTTMLLYPKHFNQPEKPSRPLILGKNEKKVELLIGKIDLNFNGKYKEFLTKITYRLEDIL